SEYAIHHRLFRFKWMPFNPDGTDYFLEMLGTSAKSYGAKLDSIKSLLQPYELTKLVPVISLVLVIGFLYLLNGPIAASVSNLPPHLSYSPDELIGRALSQDERLLLIRKYPTAESFNQAYYLALEGAKVEAQDTK